MINYQLIPSLLSANQLNLAEEILQLLSLNIKSVHLDIMDNHFVPNLSFGSGLCAQLHKQYPQLKLDVHLMTYNIDDLIKQFAICGATRISIHPETTIHLERSLTLIKQNKCQAGIVLNPTATPEILKWCHYLLDFILIMTVNPGFSSQKFIPEVLTKISWIRENFPKLNICVDGGIDEDNIATLADLGVTQFVLGSAIFSKNNIQQQISKFKNILDNS